MLSDGRSVSEPNSAEPFFDSGPFSEMPVISAQDAAPPSPRGSQSSGWDIKASSSGYFLSASDESDPAPTTTPESGRGATQPPNGTIEQSIKIATEPDLDLDLDVVEPVFGRPSSDSGMFDFPVMDDDDFDETDEFDFRP
jgi:hypothetical protein